MAEEDGGGGREWMEWRGGDDQGKGEGKVEVEDEVEAECVQCAGYLATVELLQFELGWRLV
jgi:hypothetical protein